MSWYHSRAIKHMLFYGLGLFMMKGLSLIMLPLLAHSLSQADIGKLELLTSVSAFAGIIVGLSMHEVLYRFVGQSQIDQKKPLANQIYLLSLLIAACFVPVILILCLFAERYSSMFQISELVTLSLGLSIEGAIGISLAWLRMQDKAKAFVVISLLTCALQASLILTFILLDFGIVGVLLSSVIAHTIQLIVLHRVNRFVWLSLPKMKVTLSYLRYSLPIALSGLLAFGLNGAEKWILSSSSNLEQLAIYAIAAKFALAMCILVQPFGMWWMPKRFHYLSENDRKFSQITHYGIVWIVLLSSSIVYAAPIFIQLLLPSSYLSASQYLVGTLVIAMLKEITELTNIGLLFRKKTRTLLHINLLATLIALSMAWLLRDYLIWGILASLVAAQLIRLILITYISQTLYPIKYHYFSILLLLSLCSVHFLISFNLNNIGLLVLFALIAPFSILGISYITNLLPSFGWLSSLTRSEKAS